METYSPKIVSCPKNLHGRLRTNLFYQLNGYYSLSNDLSNATFPTLLFPQTEVNDFFSKYLGCKLWPNCCRYSYYCLPVEIY